ncbi:FG-GAP-like repeat-containing protein [Streptomyces lateritius]|uniref:FG-GAP-like repeat-containing protein n=1 Tax=Streptomyces lateritius TaxID=67313 RepID=A0ABW6YBD2_9ACTN
MTRTARLPGRRRALVAALAVLASSAALTTVTAAPAQAAEAVPQQRVLFTEYKDVDGIRTSTLVTVDADGTDRRELTPTGQGLPKAEITGVSFSPDGLRMAFISNDGFADIWVANADGTDARPVRMDIDEPDGWLNELDWTPDGKQLYLSFRAKPGHDRLRLMRVDVDGTGLGYVFASPEKTWDTQVDVAWDGRIAFLRGRTIHLWDPRVGGEPKPVTQGLHPTFSPDGRRIAFANGGDGSYDVHGRVLASGVEYEMTEGENVMFPEWSPDGTTVAYISGGTKQQATVTLARPAPQTPKVLTGADATAADIGWAPPRGATPAGTVRRDYSGDGITDVLALDSSGVLWRYAGNGTGGLKPRVKLGWGWKGYRFTAPGDLNADTRPDLIAQDATGGLWRLDGDGSGGFKPKVKIGTGWKDFRLTSFSDVSHDGFPDLMAVDASGAGWLYQGDGRGGLQPRVGDGWGFEGWVLTGVGALAGNGDGRQSLLARRPNGELLRFDGGMSERQKIGWGWQKLTPTGVGDLTGDGSPDVIARDTSGVLWRYDGNGAGGLKPRVKLGWGWSGITTF